jgi:hypothetical protein
MSELQNSICWTFLGDGHGQVALPVGTAFGLSTAAAALLSAGLNDGMACEAKVDRTTADICLTFHCENAKDAYERARIYFRTAMRAAIALQSDWQEGADAFGQMVH